MYTILSLTSRSCSQLPSKSLFNTREKVGISIDAVIVALVVTSGILMVLAAYHKISLGSLNALLGKVDLGWALIGTAGAIIAANLINFCVLQAKREERVVRTIIVGGGGEADPELEKANLEANLEAQKEYEERMLLNEQKKGVIDRESKDFKEGTRQKKSELEAHYKNVLEKADEEISRAKKVAEEAHKAVSQPKKHPEVTSGELAERASHREQKEKEMRRDSERTRALVMDSFSEEMEKIKANAEKRKQSEEANTSARNAQNKELSDRLDRLHDQLSKILMTLSLDPLFDPCLATANQYLSEIIAIDLSTPDASKKIASLQKEIHRLENRIPQIKIEQSAQRQSEVMREALEAKAIKDRRTCILARILLMVDSSNNPECQALLSQIQTFDCSADDASEKMLDLEKKVGLLEDAQEKRKAVEPQTPSPYAAEQAAIK